jgi:hypothetical protein
VTDVLVFRTPKVAGALTLRLEAERVGEKGVFAFVIPARDWTKEGD